MLSLIRVIPNSRIASLLVLLTVTVLSLSFLHNRLTYASDTLVYLDGAASLAETQRYTSGGTPQTAWPPGYSFLLSVFYRVGFESVALIKGLNIALAALALLVNLLVLRRMASDFALPTIVLTGVYFPWIYYTHFVGSDMLFCLVVSLFLYGAVRSMQPQDKAGLILAGVAVAVAPLVRMAGVALFIPWLVLLSLRHLSGFFSQPSAPAVRRPPSVLCPPSSVFSLSFLLFTLLPLALWAWRNYGITGTWTSVQTGVTPEYLASMHEMGIERINLLSKLWVNSRGYAHILVVPDQSRVTQLLRLPFMVNLVCTGLSLTVVVGWVRAFKHKAAIVPGICFAVYGGMLLVHNWYDIRYLLPVLPLYFAYLAGGLFFVGTHVLEKGPFSGIRTRANVLMRYAVLTVLCALVVANAAISVASSAAARLRSPHYTGTPQDLYEACAFLRKAGAEYVLVSSRGFTGQWIGSKVASVIDLLDQDGSLKDKRLPAGIDYVISHSQGFVDYDGIYLVPLIEANRGGLEPVYSNATVVVYHRTGKD